jgi:hypothetical protein
VVRGTGFSRQPFVNTVKPVKILCANCEVKMNKKYLIIQILFMLFVSGCVVPFIPEINEKDEMIVVQGLITDQPGPNTIKLSKSTPLWTQESLTTLRDCTVWITDNEGHSDTLKETLKVGIYITDPTKFRGMIGRTYILHVKTTKAFGRLTFESLPMKMNPVPLIDSVYYVRENFDLGNRLVEGCRILISTHDLTDQCKFYRWTYSESWEFHVPYKGPNQICWKSGDSKQIFIKNADILSENKISGFPLITISDPIDKLSVKYSMLVNQYSMNEDEYLYWERFRNISEQTGGLYDIIPAPIPNNIFCVENPSEKTLGYFSVSGISSERIFIKEKFAGLNALYERCLSDTIFTTRPDTLHGLGQTLWIIEDYSNKMPPAVIYTTERGCVDCTTQGTFVKPSFWDDDKKAAKTKG